MNDMILRTAIGAKSVGSLAASRMRSFARNERGDVVQTVILIAIFVIAAVFVGGAIMAALKTQSTKISTCITGVNGTDSCKGTFK